MRCIAGRPKMSECIQRLARRADNRRGGTCFPPTCWCIATCWRSCPFDEDFSPAGAGKIRTGGIQRRRSAIPISPHRQYGDASRPRYGRKQLMGKYARPRVRTSRGMCLEPPCRSPGMMPLFRMARARMRSPAASRRSFKWLAADVDEAPAEFLPLARAWTRPEGVACTRLFGGPVMAMQWQYYVPSRSPACQDAAPHGAMASSACAGAK